VHATQTATAATSELLSKKIEAMKGPLLVENDVETTACKYETHRNETTVAGFIRCDLATVAKQDACRAS
jgi:hypothetical protein